MGIDKWIKALSRVIEQAKKEGKNSISYVEVSTKLGISPNYARDIMKAFVVSNEGYTYSRGELRWENE